MPYFQTFVVCDDHHSRRLFLQKTGSIHAVLHKRNGSQVQLSCRSLLSQQAGRREDLPVNQQLGDWK